MRTLLLTGMMGLGLLSPAAYAGTPYPIKMTCPVGGERFTHVATGSYSTWGARPDGKPYGSWTFPSPLPQCPKNGLVLFKEFTAPEVAKLRPLIASPEYRAMVQRDTPYYRASWLARTVAPAEATWLLLQAAWEADDKIELRRRYLAEFAEAAAAQPRAADDEMAWLVLQARAVNARRELGQFEEAKKQLEALSSALAHRPAAKTEDGEEDAERREGLASYLKDLETLVARRDASAEPLDVIPRREAAGKCLALEESGAPADPLCGSAAIQAEIAEIRELTRP